MIEWVSNWLKQIILLVLIATFLDLLLPNNAMDRYVKLVMGLLIIMAILSPILQFIHSDIDIFSIALGDKYENTKQMESVDQIKEKSNNLKKSQEAFVQKEVEGSLDQTVTKEISQQFPVEVVQTKVKIQNKENRSEIKRVQIIARMKLASTPKETEYAIKPVEPVNISGDFTQSQKRTPSDDIKRSELARKITRYLKERWHLLSGQISVRVEPV